jgi:hypothetical protein
MRILGFIFQAYQVVLLILAIVAVTYISTMVKEAINKRRHRHEHHHVK